MASIHFEPFLCRNSFRNEQIGSRIVGFQFHMILTDTRGDFLSCLEDFKVCVNEKTVNPADVFLSVGSRQYNVCDLPFLFDVFWPLDQEAIVTVLNGVSLEELLHLEVSFGLRMAFVGDWDHRLVVPKHDRIDFGG